MKTCSINSYKPIKTALKETGFKVEKVEKQKQKTIITVIPCDRNVNRLEASLEEDKE